MDLQLKRVSFSERLSQETNAFAADLWFRGKKVGYAENDGHGGCTNVQPYPETREQFQEAATYAKTLPEIVYEGRGGLKGFSIDSNLENQVDELFTQWLEAKEAKANSNKGIYYEQPNGVRMISKWKGFTIAKLKKHPQGMAIIRKAVLELQSEGNTILNTNLPEVLG